MKKRAKKLFITLLIICVFLGISILLYFGIKQAIIQPEKATQFEQFTSPPRESSCEIQDFFTRNNLISSSEAIILTPLSTFKFITSVKNKIEIFECKTIPSGVYNTQETYIDDDGCQHWSYDYDYTETQEGSNCCMGYWRRNTCAGGTLTSSGWCGYTAYCGGEQCDKCYCTRTKIGHINDYGGLGLVSSKDGCDYEVQVYKDNILIDKVRGEGLLKQRAYADDGAVIIDSRDLAGKSGLEVEFGQNKWYNYNCLDECQIRHWYRLYIPEGYLNIETTTPKTEYLEKEEVKVNIKILNNFNIGLLGKLSIKYEVPTIIGTKEDIRDYDISITSGENNFDYAIPTEVRTERLEVTPSISFYMPTADYKGLNVLRGFEEFGLERAPINANEKFRIAYLQEDKTTISIKSEVEELKEELILTEQELALLNASLQEKLRLIEEYKGNIEEQTRLMNSLSLTLQEKIQIINKLKLNLDEQAQLIRDLNATSQEQAEIIKSLRLSISEQADLITEMKLKVSEQAEIIKELDLTIQQQADLISEMKLTVQQQADLINKLELTIQEQISLIKELNLKVQEQITLVSQLELTISEQAQLINKLDLNLQQKALLIQQLQIKNEDQAKLIAQMELSFSEQAEIIKNLKNLVSDDAVIIQSLYTKIDDQAKLIKELELTIDELKQLVSQLDLTIQEQAQLINLLDLKVQEQAEIIKELNLNIQQQADLINQLDLTNKELGQLVSEFELTIQEQADLIAQLEKTVKEKGEIIAQLELTIEEEAFLIQQYQLTLDEQAQLIAELELRLDEEKKLVSLLYSELDKQKELLDKIDEYKESWIEKYWWILLITVTVIIVVIVIILLTKKRK